MSSYKTIDGIDTSRGVLKYVEMPEGLRMIKSRAFENINSLDISLFKLPSTLVGIHLFTFSSAFDGNSVVDTFKIPGSVAFMGYGAFANFNTPNKQENTKFKIQFGDKDNPSKLTFIINPGISYVIDNLSQHKTLNSTYYLFTTSSGYKYPTDLSFYYDDDDRVNHFKELISIAASSTTSKPGTYFARISNKEYVDTRVTENEGE